MQNLIASICQRIYVWKNRNSELRNDYYKRSTVLRNGRWVPEVKEDGFERVSTALTKQLIR